MIHFLSPQKALIKTFSLVEVLVFDSLRSFRNFEFKVAVTAIVVHSEIMWGVTLKAFASVFFLIINRKRKDQTHESYSTERKNTEKINV